VFGMGHNMVNEESLVSKVTNAKGTIEHGVLFL
jgi:hypothetical protein